MTIVLNDKDHDDLKFIEDPVLTTIDNPFNPKTHYLNWKTWDESNGYHTEALIARVANIPLNVDSENDVLIDEYVEQAQYNIIDNDVNGVYVLV